MPRICYSDNQTVDLYPVSLDTLQDLQPASPKRITIVNQLGKGHRCIAYSVRVMDGVPRLAKVCSPDYDPGNPEWSASQEKFAKAAQLQKDLLNLNSTADMEGLYKEGENGPYWILGREYRAKTLDKLTDNTVQLSTMLDSFLRIAEGLKAYHDAGYIVVDLKPSNILVLDNGAICGCEYIDFDSVTNSSVTSYKELNISSTLQYAAPEIKDEGLYREYGVGSHTDCFSFGRTVLYTLFRDENARYTSGRYFGPMDSDFDFLRSDDWYFPAISRRILKNLLSRTISIKPSDRGSLEEIIADLTILKMINLKYADKMKSHSRLTKWSVFPLFQQKYIDDVLSQKHNSIREYEKAVEEICESLMAGGLDRLGLQMSSTQTAAKMNEEETYWPIGIKDNGSLSEFLSRSWTDQNNPKHVVLTGQGGAGKSTLLKRFFSESAVEDTDKPIVLYLDLVNNEPDYGLDCFYHLIAQQYGGFLDLSYDESLIKNRLQKLFGSSPKTHPDYILLIDGLNETGEYETTWRSGLNKLADNSPCIQIVAASRTMPASLSKAFGEGTLLHLTLTQLREIVGEKRFQELPESIIKFLLTPFYLKLYLGWPTDLKDSKDDLEQVSSPADFLNYHMKRLLEQGSYSIDNQEAESFCLNHLFPFMAFSLGRSFTEEAFKHQLDVARDSLISGKTACDYKSSYSDRSRILQNPVQCLELLVRKGILYMQTDQTVRYCHDNFYQYFYALFIKNEMTLRKDSKHITSLYKSLLTPEIALMTGQLFGEHRYVGKKDSSQLVKWLHDHCNTNTSPTLIANIIEMIKTARQGDLSNIDFSNLNLMSTNLSGDIILSGSRFNKSKINKKCFSPVALGKNIEISPNGNTVVFEDEDGFLRSLTNDTQNPSLIPVTLERRSFKVTNHNCYISESEFITGEIVVSYICVVDKEKSDIFNKHVRDLLEIKKQVINDFDVIEDKDGNPSMIVIATNQHVLLYDCQSNRQKELYKSGAQIIAVSKSSNQIVVAFYLLSGEIVVQEIDTQKEYHLDTKGNVPHIIVMTDKQLAYCGSRDRFASEYQMHLMLFEDFKNNNSQIEIDSGTILGFSVQDNLIYYLSENLNSQYTMFSWDINNASKQVVNSDYPGFIHKDSSKSTRITLVTYNGFYALDDQGFLYDNNGSVIKKFGDHSLPNWVADWTMTISNSGHYCAFFTNARPIRQTEPRILYQAELRVINLETNRLCFKKQYILPNLDGLHVAPYYMPVFSPDEKALFFIEPVFREEERGAVPIEVTEYNEYYFTEAKPSEKLHSVSLCNMSESETCQEIVADETMNHIKHQIRNRIMLYNLYNDPWLPIHNGFEDFWQYVANTMKKAKQSDKTYLSEHYKKLKALFPQTDDYGMCAAITWCVDQAHGVLVWECSPYSTYNDTPQFTVGISDNARFMTLDWFSTRYSHKIIIVDLQSVESLENIDSFIGSNLKMHYLLDLFNCEISGCDFRDTIVAEENEEIFLDNDNPEQFRNKLLQNGIDVLV